MHNGDISTNVVGSAPTIFWGELYANFNYTGIVLGSLIVGYLLYFINFYLFKMNFNSITVSLCIWLLMHYKDLSITGFGNYLIDLNLLLILAAYLLLKPQK